MKAISVWCEYDISGNFGGNNDQEVFLVPTDSSTQEVEDLLKLKYQSLWDEMKEEEDLEEDSLLSVGLMGWEFINIETLGE